MRITAVTTALPSLRKPRLLSFARTLRLAGHEVSVIATSDHSQGGEPKSESGLMMLKGLGVCIVHVPFELNATHLARAATSVALRRSCSETALYDSPSLATRVARAIDATHPDVVHVDRIRALSLLRYSLAPIVVDVTDPRAAAYQHYRRAGQLSPLRVGIAETVRARVDQRPAAREECADIRGIPALVASELGRETLLRSGIDPGLVWQVPNAVFDDERAEPLSLRRSATAVLGMSGNLSYPPNVLGFDALAKEILPRVRDEIAAKMVVVGSSPHPLLIRRARRAAVELYPDVASVPGTIRRLGVSLMLAPQRVSAGFPNRVVDAVYRAGVPILASLETVRGAPDILARQLPVASTPDEWLQQVRALTAEGVGSELVAELQQHIDRACGPHTVASALMAAYGRAMGCAAPVTEQSRCAAPDHRRPRG